jgi:hypothetical protein
MVRCTRNTSPLTLNPVLMVSGDVCLEVEGGHHGDDHQGDRWCDVVLVVAVVAVCQQPHATSAQTRALSTFMTLLWHYHSTFLAQDTFMALF